MKKTAVAVAVAASAMGFAQFAAADFVKDSKLSLDLRNYYFNTGADAFGAAEETESGQWGQAFMLNYKSGFTEGPVGFGVDLFGAAAYKLADHGDAGTHLFQATGGEVDDRLSKGGATVKARVAGTTAYAGTLRPNTPVFISNDARMLPQLVEGVMVTNQDVAGLTLAAAHVSKFQERHSAEWADLGDEQFSLFGADYKVMDSLTAQYYYGQVNNSYTQHFAGLKYAADMGPGKLGADVRYFITGDDDPTPGPNEDDNNLWSVLVNYSVAGHTLGLGYQHTSEDFTFANVGKSKYLISERMLGAGAMHNPDEAVTLVSYGFDFGTVGVKGLSASVVHQMGDSGIGREVGKDTGVYQVVDHTETDVIVGYTVPEGQLKGLGARVMHAMYDGDDKFADENQTRVIVSYSIPLM